MPNTYVYNVFTAPKAGEAVDLIPDRVTFDAATGKATYEEGLANGRFAAPKNLDVQKDGTVYTLSGFVPDINQDGVADNTAADGIYITTMKVDGVPVPQLFVKSDKLESVLTTSTPNDAIQNVYNVIQSRAMNNGYSLQDNLSVAQMQNGYTGQITHQIFLFDYLNYNKDVVSDAVLITDSVDASQPDTVHVVLPPVQIK